MFQKFLAFFMFSGMALILTTPAIAAPALGGVHNPVPTITCPSGRELNKSVCATLKQASLGEEVDLGRLAWHIKISAEGREFVLENDDVEAFLQSYKELSELKSARMNLTEDSMLEVLGTMKDAYAHHLRKSEATDMATKIEQAMPLNQAAQLILEHMLYDKSTYLIEYGRANGRVLYTNALFYEALKIITERYDSTTHPENIEVKESNARVLSIPAAAYILEQTKR